MRLRIRCISGIHAGIAFDFHQPVIAIGRDTASDLELELEPRVSGKHCEVFDQNGHPFVRDVGSMNGTWIDARRIAQPARIQHGSMLQLGEKGPIFTLELLREADFGEVFADTSGIG